MLVQRDGSGQPYIEWEQAGGHYKRAWVQRKQGTTDWAQTGVYINVVRCNSPGHPGGNPTDFPIFNPSLTDEQILEAIVQSVNAITGCKV
jgi:hypothetical protein